MLSTVQEEGIFAPFRSDEEIFSLAAEGLVNAQKPHQGFSSENVSLHPGATACNSTTALGVSWRQWSGSVPGATVTYEYDAFGNKINSTGSTPNNFMYRGEEFDPDLGLYYLRARYMNPLTGRFMSRDPGDGDVTDPATLHKYLYADADPVNGSDPTGWMDGAAGTMPGTRAGVGSAIGEYAVIVLQALSVSVAVADVGCAASTAYYVLAADLRFDTNITKGKCEARGEGRMRVQLQLGLGNGKSLTPWGMAARNQDPPGVTLSQVGGLLTALWGAANSGTIPRFPKSENYDLYNAIIAASLCAKSYVPAGTWGLDKTICSEPVGNSGWRVDLDQLNGRNLTQ